MAATVFVSYRTPDADLALKLAGELRAAGHTVRLDRWDLNIGDSIILWMNESLTNAAYVVVCYSDSGVLAPWMSREWASTLARQLNGHNVTLLPARLSGGEPPSILADIKYADLVADWQRGVAELLQAIR
jgi:hypothetical protein